MEGKKKKRVERDVYKRLGRQLVHRFNVCLSVNEGQAFPQCLDDPLR